MSADPGRRVSEQERLRRWRLVLGGGDADGTQTELRGDDRRIDGALGALYDRQAPRGAGSGRARGLARSAPGVSRWLGDIRRYFPTPVVQILQRDAIERLELRQLLLEPELLDELEPDVHLVTMLMELNRALPETTRAAARAVVAQVLAQIEARLADRTRQAVHGALARAQRTRRPRPADIDWLRTVRRNLRNWIPELRTVVPEHLVGFGRHQRSLARDLIIAVDQSGSMAGSVVHASVFACVLGRLPALRTSLVVFDTAVADLTPVLADPVDVVFGVQLGGGTDIGGALGYCRRLVSRPRDTVLLLISDLFEGGNVAALRTQVATLVRDGVTVVVLLALSDEGVPTYDHHEAAALGALGAAVLACTPDTFPDLLAAALEGRAGDDLARWAAERGLTTL